ncbi:MAG TPA: chloride channel protein, partial [Terriglobia bacterium]|nr:chloride channel protein [Terriglobia bacterium]
MRVFSIKLSIPHWVKMAVGGFLTGLSGLLFVSLFPGSLIPLGPNYEAVGEILLKPHSSLELVVFGFVKLAATLFSLGVGGVSAMFVPLFLTGGSFGAAFAQMIGHSPSLDLYAAVGMAAFIAGGYKAPLTAVVFVAEATGGHSYIIPTLIGAAVAYAVSGEASASGDQRLHETVRLQELRRIPVSEVMQRQIVSVQASSTLREFADGITAHHCHTAFPVHEDHQIVGVITLWTLGQVPAIRWSETEVREWIDRETPRIHPDCDLMEALRLLMSQSRRHMLLVISADGKLAGVVTKTDILGALNTAATNGSNSGEH